MENGVVYRGIMGCSYEIKRNNRTMTSCKKYRKR